MLRVFGDRWDYNYNIILIFSFRNFYNSIEFFEKGRTTIHIFGSAICMQDLIVQSRLFWLCNHRKSKFSLIFAEMHFWQSKNEETFSTAPLGPFKQNVTLFWLISGPHPPHSQFLFHKNSFFQTFCGEI